MLLSLDHLVVAFDMKVTGVLHVGAHLAEEAEVYHALDMEPVLWVEANAAVLPQIAANLERYPAQSLVHALVYSEDDVELPFHITNYDGMSSSIYEFGTHPEFSPDTYFERTDVLRTRTLDAITEVAGFSGNFLNMDLQGAELQALMGATEFLKGVDYINTEVNCKQVYKGCAQVSELDALLVGFERVRTVWVDDQGWGDAFYVRVPS